MHRTIARVNRVVRVARFGGTSFSPTTLPGYVNSPYNIALLRSQGKLWQDTAMTVPATADGDPVRRIDCGGTYYDAPSDATRPLLYSEGGGKWSLSFDGVDDYFTTPSLLTFSDCTVGWGTVTTIGGEVLIGGPSQYLVEYYGGKWYTYDELTDSGTDSFTVTVYHTCVFRRSGSSISRRVNGVEVGAYTSSSPLKVSRIGRRESGNLFLGRVRGIVLATGYTANPVDLESYYATL